MQSEKRIESIKTNFLSKKKIPNGIKNKLSDQLDEAKSLGKMKRKMLKESSSKAIQEVVVMRGYLKETNHLTLNKAAKLNI